MSEIEKLIQELCPDGVEFKKLGEIGTFIRGKYLQKKDFQDDGYPCIHYGQIYTFYKTSTSKTISFVSNEVASKSSIASHGDLIITLTSENIDDVCTPLAWLGEHNVAISSHAAIFKHNQNSKYLSYLLQTDFFKKEKNKIAHGTKVIEIKPDNLAKIEIPVPPLEVQQKIVEILDNFTSLTAELEAELEARKRQYEYYRNLLLTFNPVANGAVTGGDQQIGDGFTPPLSH